MQFHSLKFLSDENVSPRLISFLRQKEIDVIDVKEKGWQGKDDKYILEKAYREERFIITHDSDFGTLAINKGIPCYGVIYLRLKNLKIQNQISVLKKLLLLDTDINKGAIIVAEDTRVRIRNISE